MSQIEPGTLAAGLGKRPLTARSVVASTLLGTYPPRMATRLLVRTGELFGISEGATRVAVSRMVNNGELVADGNGYRLAGALLDRQARQDASRQAERGPWDGHWDLAVVVEGRRAATQRSHLRDAMRRLRLAELREGTWMRPANLAPTPETADRLILAEQCERFSALPRDEPERLAAELWDLDGWAAEAHRLIGALATWNRPLDAGDVEALAPSFVVSAAVLRHFLADPLLPDQLLPPNWPGEELRSAYATTRTTFVTTYVGWLDEQTR
jgi:phenylacetic acid degradation operon negative regulatory protein